ncbi:zinc-binding dehydrogenase [Rossellomorea marisflavi]|uniref:zinc-binding dehydrogenase n=1 Tax=Rossellomorea marisflavi TaxID=189381 RepID=UPI00064F681A|nr:zinc-binding dehydrogenase [Rossellomorea marisflavi]KMK91896.1 zinc-binding alcohol dehydrogenase [Rossellomorea marisflavi]
MKALLLKGKNQWEEMKVEEVDRPSPGKGEILVEIHAAGLNPVDYKTGTNGNAAWSYPHILGLDGAGVVVELGEGVEHLKIGDRVLYHGDWTKKGAFAEFSTLKAHTVSIIPDSVSFEEAAALPTAGYTAYQALHRKLPLDQIQTILIHGGAGGVGGFGVQLAKLQGKTIISTASEHNHEYVKSLGADYVVDYKKEDVVKKVRELTDGRGVDAVVDAVSRQSATESLDMLAYMGHIAYIAGAPDLSGVSSFSIVPSVHEIALQAGHHAGDLHAEKDFAAIGDALLDLVASGKIDPMLAETVGLEEVPGALKRLSERHVKGKIVAFIK